MASHPFSYFLSKISTNFHIIILSAPTMPAPFLSAFLFPMPPSLFVSAMSLFSPIFAAIGGLSETRGNHVQYSKFWNAKSSPLARFKLSARVGMVLLYTPGLLSALASFVVFRDTDNLRLLLIRSTLALHFFKRLFEVLFVHKYSSNVVLEAELQIALSYILLTSTMIYAQYLSKDFPEPSIDLKYIGVAFFLIGISGNFYHHYLLAKLREGGSKEYKIPKGGLFSLVVCPHYLFEIIEFIGFTLISQTVYSVSMAAGSMLYLMGRSYATREWYLSKFEDFPKGVKCLIPFVY